LQLIEQLILASASPRRKTLLESVGLEFGVMVADIDESRNQNESANDYVLRLSREKAQKVQSQINTGQNHQSAILAADTIVAYRDDVFSKPSNFQDAKRIWQTLSGRQHRVCTAVTLMVGDHQDSIISVTEVEFIPIKESQMQAYWATSEPKDKAGAYAIQGDASAWVKAIHGSYSNVVGLPLFEVNNLLAKYNLNWL
jgi:septum formation protein